jgi:hypothetical protein
MDQRPIPTYYVREETTAGPLYFWPISAVDRAQLDTWQRKGLVWYDEEGTQAEVRGGYVITVAHTPTLTAMWPERPRVSHYARKPEADMSPVARTLAAADPATYPAELPRGEWEGRCEYGPDSDCYDCTWHKVRDGLYQKVMTEPGIGQQTFDVSGLDELDIYQVDPAPELAWTLDSPSLAAFYPRPAHHQFPGHLDGVELFRAVASAAKAALSELGIPFNVYDYDDRNLKLSALVDIPWDESLPYNPIKPGRSQKAKEANHSRKVRSVLAMKWASGDVLVPRRIAGATKAEAVSRRAELLDELVSRLVPPHSVACEKCKGTGYVR